MPEHLKALVVILGLSLPIFYFGRRLLTVGLMTDEAFVLRRNVWIAITVIAFLAHNFWLYVLGTAVILIAVRGREQNPVAMFFFVLFSVPPIQVAIPGLGILGHVFAIDHLRLLVLVVLLPSVLARPPAPVPNELRVPFGRATTDRFLICYLLMLLGFQFVLNAWTGAVRASFYLVVDIVIPYYAASRLLRNGDSLKEAVASLVMAISLIAPVALFEYSRHWLLYSALDQALGVDWGFGSYLGRDDSLRALASSGHPITLGYLVSIGLCLYVFVSGEIGQRRLRLAIWAMLAVALFTTLSRGPWIGCTAGMLAALCLREDAKRQIGRIIGVGVIAVPLILVSPWRDALLRYLPFVGSVDVESVDYRQQLFNVSMQVLAQNPIFGAYDYMQNPAMEQLRQGQGLIDMVNTYLAVAMSSGLFGLTLFGGILVSAAWVAWRRLRQCSAGEEQRRRLGIAIVAAMVSAMVTIATTSPVGAIGLLYWMLSGLAVAYATVTVWDTRSEMADRSPVAWTIARRPGTASPGMARVK